MNLFDRAINGVCDAIIAREKLLNSYIHKKTSFPQAKQRKIFLGMGKNITKVGDERPIDIPESILNRHAYLIGATGSGKSILLRYLVYQLIRAGYGVLFIDMKGEYEIWEDMWKACYFSGRQNDFTYFSPIVGSDKFPRTTVKWNPLILGDANVVTSKIMDAIGNDDPASQFYEKVKYDVLFCIISCMKEIDAVPTLKDIAFVFESPTNMDMLIKMTPEGESKRNLHSKLIEWNTNPRLWVQNYTGTKVAIKELCTGLQGTLCNAVKPTLSVTDMIEKGGVTYCYLPTMIAKDAMRSIGKMMLSEIKTVAGNIQAFKSDKVKFAIIVDEFEELVFKAVKDLFNKARSAGISMIIGHQTLSDIDYEVKSKSFALSIMDNTASKLIMQIKSKASAELFAENIGEYKPIPFLSRWITTKYVVHPDDLMGKSSLNDEGLEVGELIAKIDAELYRVKVPYPPKAHNIKIGKDIPWPTREYPEYDYGEALNLVPAETRPIRKTAKTEEE
jgi:hypothetical protein